jgi:hypothetical protein
MLGTVRTTRPYFNLVRVVINALPPKFKGGPVAESGPGMAQAPFRGHPAGNLLTNLGRKTPHNKNQAKLFSLSNGGLSTSR